MAEIELSSVITRGAGSGAAAKSLVGAEPGIGTPGNKDWVAARVTSVAAASGSLAVGRSLGDTTM
ncbi:hypothetical protein AB3Y40_17455 [Yoonia sp. R2331]|uniref:hypothetical protein n=1 Tax=Yoonia sp. R2331 TaxID=3237238 RepID=UPI0034E441C0